MKILPIIKTLSIEKEDSNILNVNINESAVVKYKLSENYEEKLNIAQDLIDCRAFGTLFLFLNESFKVVADASSLILSESVSDFYEDCNSLLNENIQIVEEIGKPLVEIDGYPIFESDSGILRGAGKKKIKEHFEEELSDELKAEIEKFIVDSFTSDTYTHYGFGLRKPYTTDAWMYGIYQHVNKGIPSYEILSRMKKYYEEVFNKVVEEHNLKEDAEGTQTTDIASKADQDLGLTDAEPKKKHYDILLGNYDNNELDESISFKGFLKNSEGHYQRGNYILVKEGDKYFAINKNKLKGE